MTNEDFRVSEQPYCPKEKVSKSITNDKIEVSAIRLRLIEASVLEEILEFLEEMIGYESDFATHNDFIKDSKKRRMEKRIIERIKND